jgi:protein-S-isoprenylcysteine O-methyltransferase Ste14
MKMGGLARPLYIVADDSCFNRHAMTHDPSSERGADVRFPPPLVFAGLAALGVILDYVLGPIPVASRTWIGVVGIVFLVAGFALVVSAILEFQRTGQDPKPWKPTPEMVFRGAYRYTRNPMYVGLAGLQLGLGLLLGYFWISVLAPVALLVVHQIAVLPEERYLREKFGSSFTEYCRRVRRYL